MKLPLLPQGELLLGLLLLMKLLVPVYGIPLEMHRSLRDQVSDPPKLAEVCELWDVGLESKMWEELMLSRRLWQTFSQEESLQCFDIQQ